LWILAFTICFESFLLFPWLRTVFAVAVLLLLGVFVYGVACIRSGFFGKVYFRAFNEDRRIALTFDDGPDPALTPDVLDMLDCFGYKATFFVVGRNAEKYPDIVRRAHDAGHIVACHDLTHKNTSNFRMTDSAARDIGEAASIIEKIIGKKPLLYRPPAGLLNPHIIKALKRLGMSCIGWSERVRDSGNRRKNRIFLLYKMAKPGSVILLHDCLPVPDNKPVFLEQLEKLFISIREKGLNPVGLDEMFSIRAYLNME